MKAYLGLLCMMLCLLKASAGEYEINVPKLGASSKVVAIELTGEELNSLGETTDWIRLYDCKGNVVPFALEMATVKDYVKKQVRTPLKLTQARHMDDGSLEILCSADMFEYMPERMTIAFPTQMRDFEQQVTVWGVDADGKEHILLEDGFIFDSTANISLRNVEVEIKPGVCRSFRIRLKSASIERHSALRELSRQWDKEGASSMKVNETVLEQAFKIDALEFIGEQLVPSGEVKLWSKAKCEISENERNVPKGVSSFFVKPGAYPVNGFYFNCKEENFSRKINVYFMDDIGQRLVASQKISRINLGRLQESTFIAFKDIYQVGTFLIECENLDNPPLHFTSIESRTYLYHLRFLANADMLPLKLTSIPFSKAPEYDMKALLEFGSSPANDIVVHLGKMEGEKTSLQVKSRGMPRFVLYIAVGLAVIVMGAGIFSTLRKLEH